MSTQTHLFVYGTLVSTVGSDLGRDMRLRLRREARVVGTASIRARLYDLGRYPALVLSAEAIDVVHGELLELSDPEVSLVWLDAYEGIGRGAQHADEYSRVESEVTLSSGGEMTAWVYVFQRAVTGIPRIRSGRWQPRK